MIYYTIPPAPEISSYVRFFWVLESNASGEHPYIHRSLADGCCEIIFHYQGKFDEVLTDGSLVSSLYSGVSGPSQKFSRFCIREGFGIFGAYLYPFAVSLLFGIPTSALSNNIPDLATVLGQEGRDLEEQIILAPDNNTRIQILKIFITSKLRSFKSYQPSVVSAILHIINMKGIVNVKDVAVQHNLSTRQFERNFKTWAGFGPKLYSRIIRFQAATSKYKGKHKSLTEVAYDCGYYDQSHFIHDFKEFSGFHPKQYFSGNNEGTSWKDG